MVSQPQGRALISEGRVLSRLLPNLIFRFTPRTLISRCEVYEALRRGVARCAYRTQGILLAPGTEIDYVVKDAGLWEVEAKRTASKIDATHYRKLLEKTQADTTFVFEQVGKRG
jgi:hypothetical protein